jgi:hypothetical protein
VAQFAEGDLIPHFQYNRSKSFDLLLHLRDSRALFSTFWCAFRNSFSNIAFTVS